MPRVDAIRDEVLRLVRAAPFRRFVLNLEDEDHVVVEHPENIVFDPDAQPAAAEFYVISGNLRMFSTFSAISSVALADREGAAA